jgi:hypothetical protein
VSSTASIAPRLTEGVFNFPIFQPARIGKALLEEHRGRFRESIFAVRPRRIL